MTSSKKSSDKGGNNQSVECPPIEWQTISLIAVCYILWFASLYWHEHSAGLWFVVTAAMVAFQSSLQHEALHGHPTRNRIVNEILVSPALGLWLPYRRYRSLHLKHHIDERLTDPLDDPESWYHRERDWRTFSRFHQYLLKLNASLAGRLVVGPFLVVWGFWTSETRLIASLDREIIQGWILHAISALPVILLLISVGISIPVYLIAVVVPSISLVLIRSFIEHRAAEEVTERTAVVEAGFVMSMLFLNNNLHAVHHQYPHLSWYTLPAKWNRERSNTLEANNHYYFSGGYLQVARKWLFHRREPLVHPRNQ